jgi:hypothetical protein
MACRESEPAPDRAGNFESEISFSISGNIPPGPQAGLSLLNGLVMIKYRIIATAAFSLMLLLLVPAFGQGQNHSRQLRQVENTSFQRGESMVFRAYYNSRLTGNVTAGEATLEIRPTNMVIGGRNSMHVVSEARTRGLFNLFFRVTNRYESYLDEQAIAPLMFIRRINEGGYIKNQDVMFNHFDNIATSNTATVPISPYVQDIISAFYFARTYDYSDAQPGDAFNVGFFLDDTVYVTRIVFDGREQIRTRVGTVNTLRFKPMVLEGTVFNQPYPMTLWITDDKNKIPVMIESGLVVGRVRLELIEYKGLRNPFTSKVN